MNDDPNACNTKWESDEYTLFTDDAIEALTQQIAQLEETVRVLTCQRNDWMSQAADAKREVKMLRKKLERAGRG